VTGALSGSKQPGFPARAELSVPGRLDDAHAEPGMAATAAARRGQPHARQGTRFVPAALREKAGRTGQDRAAGLAANTRARPDYALHVPSRLVDARYGAGRQPSASRRPAPCVLSAPRDVCPGAGSVSTPVAR
jgi:hypothetical protein